MSCFGRWRELFSFQSRALTAADPENSCSSIGQATIMGSPCTTYNTAHVPPTHVTSVDNESNIRISKNNASLTMKKADPSAPCPPHIGTLVWVQVGEWPFWPSVTVTRKWAESQVAEDLVRKFPPQSNTNCVVKFFNYDDQIDVVEATNIREFCSSISLVREAGPHKDSVHRAAQEAIWWLLKDGNGVRSQLQSLRNRDFRRTISNYGLKLVPIEKFQEEMKNKPKPTKKSRSLASPRKTIERRRRTPDSPEVQERPRKRVRKSKDKRVPDRAHKTTTQVKNGRKFASRRSNSPSGPPTSSRRPGLSAERREAQTPPAAPLAVARSIKQANGAPNTPKAGTQTTTSVATLKMLQKSTSSKVIVNELKTFKSLIAELDARVDALYRECTRD